MLVPPATPVSNPVLAPILATAVLLLVHVPPATALDKVVVSPAHSDDRPVMAARGLMVITWLVLQPVPGNV